MKRRMKIALGSDHGGFQLKSSIRDFLLKKKALSVVDHGAFSEESMDYPDTAYKVAIDVSKGRVERGILVCKTGIGNCIASNKLPGVRAALCYNARAARLSRLHNDANILVLGSFFVNARQAKKIVGIWLSTPFEGGRHQRRLKKIERIERLCARPH